MVLAVRARSSSASGGRRRRRRRLAAGAGFPLTGAGRPSSPSRTVSGARRDIPLPRSSGERSMPAPSDDGIVCSRHDAGVRELPVLGEECLAELHAGQGQHDGCRRKQDRLALGSEETAEAHPAPPPSFGAALGQVGLGRGRLGGAPCGGNEIGFGGFGVGALVGLAALVADALHDGAEIRRARAGLERMIGKSRVERLVGFDVRHVGDRTGQAPRRHAPPRSPRQFARLVSTAAKRAAQPSEQRTLATRRLFSVVPELSAATAAAAAASAGVRMTAAAMTVRELVIRFGFRRLDGAGVGCVDGRRHVRGHGAHRESAALRARFHAREPVDDLEQRVVNGLEGLGVALVRTPGEGFQGSECRSPGRRPRPVRRWNRPVHARRPRPPVGRPRGSPPSDRRSTARFRRSAARDPRDRASVRRASPDTLKGRRPGPRVCGSGPDRIPSSWAAECRASGKWCRAGPPARRKGRPRRPAAGVRNAG